MLGEYVLGHRHPANQMLLDDFLKHFGATGVIPDTLGVDHRDGTVRTDLQAIGLGSIDTTVAHQAQFQQASFQERPGLKTEVVVAAFWFALIAAQENMPLD